jgi:hypothetical protein
MGDALNGKPSIAEIVLSVAGEGFFAMVAYLPDTGADLWLCR